MWGFQSTTCPIFLNPRPLLEYQIRTLAPGRLTRSSSFSEKRNAMCIMRQGEDEDEETEEEQEYWE